MQIICKLVQMADVHNQLQSQALSFPLRHLGSFSTHMEEQDEPTCNLSTQLKQTALREWEKISHCLDALTEVASVLVALIYGIQVMHRSLLNKELQTTETSLPHTSLPSLVSLVYQGLAGVLFVG